MIALTTVTTQRNIHHFPRFLGEDQYIVYASNIRKMCPENITIPGACRELTPFFSMKYTSQWKQDGFDPPMQGFTPPNSHKFTKHGHKCSGMFGHLFLFDPPTYAIQTPFIHHPPWWFQTMRCYVSTGPRDRPVHRGVHPARGKKKW